ncbi:hypothetical protein KXD93_21255 [Mucilaginibacter sp. BJC16-A38]|uniref:hypothetical protein n=1 Tax=Mucilaginibacter phenanthrenivorans TaxID=1234842 RepID=UPI0021578131|nr:hypothetical protein [Mucilaginibacter phenanthrenivorans]MCR8560194.1 hypothetical protein [Mucilaginibacter phenanthrenivorans]
MDKLLIISDHLIMAGAERLIFEMVKFARSEHMQPVILIANNYHIEYYDAVFAELQVPVVRTTLQGIMKLRNPVNFLKALYWQIKLRYFADKYFNSVHVIGLYNVQKIFSNVLHQHRYFWHVGNAVQYFDRVYPFPESIFANEQDTLVFINTYQGKEIEQQYGKDKIKNKLSFFKLFVAADDSN